MPAPSVLYLWWYTGPEGGPLTTLREGTVMSDHPYIDFDGDGHGDSYDAVHEPSGGYAFIHHDSHGNVDAIAYDDDSDGRINWMETDEDHNGVLDHYLADDNGDGIMDEKHELHGVNSHVEHPRIDVDGDGHADQVYATSYASDGTPDNVFFHTDGHGHVDAVLFDGDSNGRIDYMETDQNHNGTLDHYLVDDNGDGIMDEKHPLTY